MTAGGRRREGTLESPVDYALLSHMDDPDTPLKQRLREKAGVGQKADSDADEQKSSHGDGHDDEDDEDDDMEMDMDAGEMPEAATEAAQMFAEMSDEDVTGQQVLEMLSPLLEGEDTRDDPAEMAMDHDDHDDEDDEDDDMEMDAETIVEEAREAARDAAQDAVESELDDLDAKLEDHAESVREDLSETLDEKLRDTADALGEEVKATMQKANVSSTNAPVTGASGDGEVSAADVLGDSHPAVEETEDSD